MRIGEGQREKQSIRQRVARVVQIFTAVGMGYEGIEAKQQSAAKDGHAVVETLAQTRSADRNRAVRQPSHHDRVHDPHAHPANFSNDERQRKAERQQKVRAHHRKRCSFEIQVTFSQS